MREPFHSTAHGAIFAADCMKVLPLLKDEVVDTVFADPPFNLGKEYGKNTDDNLPGEHYVRWCQEWLAECVRVLKPGGSLFLYNLPKWNVLLGAFLHTQGLEFVLTSAPRSSATVADASDGAPCCQLAPCIVTRHRR